MNKVGCLIIHGFGGNTNEVKPLADLLSERGFVTLCPQLEGHTGRRKDFANSNYKGWIKSAEDAFIQLKSECDNIVLLGFSLGGLIAVNLAAKYDVLAVVTLSMPVYYFDTKKLFENLKGDIKAFFKKVTKRETVIAIKSNLIDFKAESSKEKMKPFENIKKYLNALMVTPLRAILSLKAVLDKTIPLLKKISRPILIIQGLKDVAVIHKSAEYIYENVSSKVKYIKYY